MSSYEDKKNPATLLDDVSEPLDSRHHDTPERHIFGAAFLFPGIPTNVTPSGISSPGISDTPAREDHVHAYFNVLRAGSLTVEEGPVEINFVHEMEHPPIVMFVESPRGMVFRGADERGFSCTTPTEGQLTWIAVEQTE